MSITPDEGSTNPFEVGVERPEYGLVIVRHTLPSPGFETTIATVAEPGDEAAVLGEVLPEATYETPQEFEARGCDVP